MVLRIQVTRSEFNAAESNGAVYGLLKGRRGLYAYAELGKEVEYIPRTNDDPKTEYRMFRNCDAFFATSLEQLDADDFKGEELNIPNLAVISMQLESLDFRH